MVLQTKRIIDRSAVLRPVSRILRWSPCRVPLPLRSPWIRVPVLNKDKWIPDGEGVLAKKGAAKFADL